MSSLSYWAAAPHLHRTHRRPIPLSPVLGRCVRSRICSQQCIDFNKTNKYSGNFPHSASLSEPKITPNHDAQTRLFFGRSHLTEPLTPVRLGSGCLTFLWKRPVFGLPVFWRRGRLRNMAKSGCGPDLMAVANGYPSSVCPGGLPCAIPYPTVFP